MSAEQVAANLRAALLRGNAQDADSALASFDVAVADGVDFPEPVLGPIKAEAPVAEVEEEVAGDVVGEGPDADEDEVEEDA